MTPVDFAHTRVAQENREAKAQLLVETCWRLGASPLDLEVGGGGRRAVWREAGLDRSPSPETWDRVLHLLASTPRPPLQLDPVAAPAAAATAPPLRTVAGSRTVERTWRACNAPDCDAPTQLYASGWWCDPHSPWGRRGLSSSDPGRVPGQPCELDRLRAARGITASSYPPSAATVIDDRAIASGKRRSTTATYQAIKAAQDHHNRRRTA